MHDKQIGVFISIALSLLLFASSNNVVTTYAAECGDMKWSDKDHDDNNPSEKKFKEAAYEKSLCKLAKGIDHEVYHNHVKVDWDKFKASPAYLNATDDQQDCLKQSHKEGNGMDGLGGYEILYCAIDND